MSDARRGACSNKDPSEKATSVSYSANQRDLAWVADLSARLDELINQLNREDWRHMQKRLKGHSFHCDFFSALPLELVVEVTQHLAAEELFRLRRVGLFPLSSVEP